MQGTNNDNQTTPRLTGASGVPKKVSKDSAISQAFKNDLVDGVINLSQKGIGDSHINEINKNLKLNGYIHGLDLSGNKITDVGV